MNLTFTLDGYVAESSTPLLFVFDGYLYVTPPTSAGGDGGGSSSNYSSRHEEENERDRLKKIEYEDDIIISIVKAFLICQN